MHYIGLDIGGTNVRFASADSLEVTTLGCQKRLFVRTGDPYQEVNENICKIIDSVSDDAKCIGISLAAVMNRSSGEVKTWPNNPCWNHYELVNHLKGRYSVPIVIEDDANCGALGEYHFLNLSVKNMAYITIGTGIGCGLILNRSLFIGENGFAGELGHVCLGKENNKSICSCGNQGCFQSIASGPAVVKKYNAEANESLTSLDEVYSRYLLHDPVASQLFSDMTKTISMVIYNLAMCLDISIFVIGGGVSNIGTEFVSQIESQANKRLDYSERVIKIKQAQLGEFSGVYGAMHLINDYMRNEQHYDK